MFATTRSLAFNAQFNQNRQSDAGVGLCFVTDMPGFNGIKLRHGIDQKINSGAWMFKQQRGQCV